MLGLNLIRVSKSGHWRPLLSGHMGSCLLSVSHHPSAVPLQWHHNGRNVLSNHQPRDCLLSPLFRRRSKKTSKLHVTGLCVGNSPGTGEFPAQMASNTENVSIWWHHHALCGKCGLVVTHFSPWYLQQTPHSLHVKASYWVAMVSL